MKELKYQDRIKQIPDCPCCNEDFPPKIYRLITNNPLIENDIIPKAISKPNSIRGNNNKDKCLHHGISVFGSLQKALQQYNSFPPSLKEKKGFRFIAEANLISGDAIIHKSLNPIKQHYTLFEYKESDILSKFTTVKDLL
jgi:hypothetical protein